VRNTQLCGLGLFQAGFDPLQSRHAFALHIALARPGQNRLGSKTILYPKRILNGPFQEFVLILGHSDMIANESINRKSILVEMKTARTFIRAVAPRFLQKLFYTS
jgi:hypothetical protein